MQYVDMCCSFRALSFIHNMQHDLIIVRLSPWSPIATPPQEVTFRYRISAFIFTEAELGIAELVPVGKLSHRFDSVVYRAEYYTNCSGLQTRTHNYSACRSVLFY